MSSLTGLFLLIFLLMSLGNVFSVVSVFGYDADYWEVSHCIVYIKISIKRLMGPLQDVLYIIFLNVLLWIGVALLCSLFEYDIIVHPCVSHDSVILD